MYLGKAASQQRPYMAAMEAKALAHRWAIEHSSAVYMERYGTKQHTWNTHIPQLGSFFLNSFDES